METDASTVGWGCRIGKQLSRGLWSEKEKTLHINVLEIKAILNAIQQNAHLLKGREIALYGDNTTALAYIRHEGGTKSAACFLEAQKVILLAESLQITLIPRFIQGSENVIADSMSRPNQKQAMEWSLHPKICRTLWEIWGKPQIDAFATLFNNKLPRYYSPVPDPQAEGVDAFLQDWTNKDLFLFPPTKLLRRVLSKFRQSPGARAILIAPLWPQQSWFPDLLELIIDAPRRLPHWHNLLRSVDQIECLHADTFRLHAWRLSSISSESGRYLEELRSSSQHAIGTLPTPSTRGGGENSPIGVLRGASIPSHPLFRN